jgi:hypothetical protein
VFLPSITGVRRLWGAFQQLDSSLQLFQESRFQSDFSRVPIQAKLRIGQPNDKYEQEADRVAEQVMQMPAPRVQRQIQPEEEDEEEDLLQMESFSKSSVQRQMDEIGEEEEDEELPLQTKRESGSAADVTPQLAGQIEALRGSGQQLPQALRIYFEPRFGHDFSQVRIHTDSRAVESAQLLHAKAYTVGQDIVFGAAEYAPNKNEGRKLLAHELVHVIQQTNKRSSPSRRLRSSLVHESAESRLQRIPVLIPGLTLITLEAIKRYLLNCIIGAAFGVYADYVFQKAVASWRKQRFRWNTCHAFVSGIFGCLSGGVGGEIQRAIYRHTGGHLEHDWALKGAVWYLSWLYSKFPVLPLTMIINMLVKLGCVKSSELKLLTEVGYEPLTVRGNEPGLLDLTLFDLAKSFTRMSFAWKVLTLRATIDWKNWHFKGLPKRSIQNLKVMAAIIGGTVFNPNLGTLLFNLNRRLDSLPTVRLLDVMAQDINQTLQSRGVKTQQVTFSSLGRLSLIQLVKWLRDQGILEYVRPPKDIAMEQLLAAQRAKSKSPRNKTKTSTPK